MSSGITRIGYDRGQCVKDPAHVAALARENRHAHDLRERDRRREVSAYADALLDALARRGESLAPHTTMLVRLLDQYGAAALDAALQDALARGAVSALPVAHLLDQRARARRPPPPLAVALPPDLRVQDLRVTPHPLTAYRRRHPYQHAG